MQHKEGKTEVEEITEALATTGVQDDETGAAGSSVRPKVKLVNNPREKHAKKGKPTLGTIAVARGTQIQRTRSRDEVPSGQANLQTFSCQKLALLQCEYDPKKCSRCGKSASVENLKQCSRCKSAKYCSQKCQAEDWKSKHKAHCKEIMRLMEIVSYDNAGPSVAPIGNIERVKATEVGKPFKLKCSFNVHMCAFDNKLVLFGTENKAGHSSGEIEVYNTTTGQREGVLYGTEECAMGICSYVLDGVRHIVASFSGLLDDLGDDAYYPDVTRAWNVESNELLYEVQRKPWSSEIGRLYHHNSIIYAFSWKNQNISGFDVKSKLRGKPSHVLSPNLPLPSGMSSFCVTDCHGDHRLVVNYLPCYPHEHRLKRNIKCVDFYGQELWNLGDRSPTTRSHTQTYLCTDNKGHIFASDPDNHRVIVIYEEDMSVETLVTTPGKVQDITWNKETQRLHVVYLNARCTKAFAVQYDIAKQQ